MKSSRITVPRSRRKVAVATVVPAAAAVLVAGLASGAGVATAAGGTVALPGSVAPAVAHRAAVGDAPDSRSTTVHVWLAQRTAAATTNAAAVSTPGSATFHQYLTPNEYTAEYGATQAAADSVSSWLRQQGFTHVSTGAQRNYVTATAPVAKVEHAFGVQERQYKISTGKGKTETITANDRAVSVPADLAKYVLGVTGLDSASPATTHTATAASAKASAAATKPVPTSEQCSQYYGENVRTGLPAYHKATSFPTVLCGYSGAQLRSAYGMTSAATGKGQTVALIEIGTPYKMAQTLKLWAAREGLPEPKATNYSQLSLGRGNDCFNAFDIEEQLDVEATYAMAPDAHELLVGGDSCSFKYEGAQPLFDADAAVVDGNGDAPLATIASNSWGIPSESFPSAYSNILHSILLRAANEGVGEYFSSGDGPGVGIPADDPYAIAVGGTTLGLGKNTGRLFETGWSNQYLGLTKKDTQYLDFGLLFSAGGGPSLLWKEPSYQQGVVPDSMTMPGAGDIDVARRSVPDIAAVADPYTGIEQADLVKDPKSPKGTSLEIFPDGGTSLASPLVAGIVASAQEGQSTSLGFANPVLYGLAGTSAVHDALPVTAKTPDDQRALYCPVVSPDLCLGDGLVTLDYTDPQYTDQTTAVGYDNLTGIGTPNGQKFIAAIRASLGG